MSTYQPQKFNAALTGLVKLASEGDAGSNNATTVTSLKNQILSQHEILLDQQKLLLLCQNSKKESAKRISELQQMSSDAFGEIEEIMKQECILRDAATAIIDQLKDALRSFAVGKKDNLKNT
jgi:hypothetical protein